VPEGELASEAVRAASAPFSRAINVLFSPRRASNLVDESLEAGCEWSESRWAEEGLQRLDARAAPPPRATFKSLPAQTGVV